MIASEWACFWSNSCGEKKLEDNDTVLLVRVHQSGRSFTLAILDRKECRLWGWKTCVYPVSYRRLFWLLGIDRKLEARKRKRERERERERRRQLANPTRGSFLSDSFFVCYWAWGICIKILGWIGKLKKKNERKKSSQRGLRTNHGSELKTLFLHQDTLSTENKYPNRIRLLLRLSNKIYNKQTCLSRNLTKIYYLVMVLF